MATEDEHELPIAADEPWRGDLVGGGVLTVLGVLHFFVVQLGDLIGLVLLLGVWPIIGGAVAAYWDHQRGDPDRWAIAGPLSGVFGAVVVSSLVFLTGLVNLWPSFVTRWVGVGLWPTTFATLFTLVLCWTVFGYAGAWVADEGLTE